MENMDNELQAFMQAEQGDTAKETGAEKPAETTKKGKGKGKGKSTTPKAPKEEKPKRDNIAYVQGLASIIDVRRFLQIAIAKKAKSLGKIEQVTRYEKEIETAKNRLNELLATAQAAEDPVKGLLELGEDPSRVISMFIKAKECEYKKWLDENGNVPKGLLKQIESTLPEAFLLQLPDLAAELKDRFDKKDYRLQAVCRMSLFISKVNAGEIEKINDKFVDPEKAEEEKAKVQAEADAKAAKEAKAKAKEEAKAAKEAEKAKAKADKEAKKAAEKAEKEAKKAAEKAEKEASKEANKEADKEVPNGPGPEVMGETPSIQ